MEYNIKNADVQLSAHFMLHEFKSPDSDKVVVAKHLVEYLEDIFSHFDCGSITVTSGYRTPKHSISVGGSKDDAHTLGMAADVICYDSDGNVIDGKTICCYAQDLGIQGIGYMGDAVHIDTRGDGGYKNRHWWGDEIKGCNVDDFYEYFKIPKCVVSREAAENYIREAYLEFLGREADESGLEAYTAKLMCDGDYSYVDRDLMSCVEYKKLQIQKFYRILLKREASETEVENWISTERLRDIHEGIYNSEEANSLKNQ